MLIGLNNRVSKHTKQKLIEEQEEMDIVTIIIRYYTPPIKDIINQLCLTFIEWFTQQGRSHILSKYIGAFFKLEMFWARK